jgi:hypothetical protein
VLIGRTPRSAAAAALNTASRPPPGVASGSAALRTSVANSAVRRKTFAGAESAGQLTRGWSPGFRRRSTQVRRVDLYYRPCPGWGRVLSPGRSGQATRMLFDTARGRGTIKAAAARRSVGFFRVGTLTAVVRRKAHAHFEPRRSRAFFCGLCHSGPYLAVCREGPGPGKKGQGRSDGG